MFPAASARPLSFTTTRLLLIVAVTAFARPAGAATVSEDVPVPGGTAALAQALGIDPAPDRGRFVYEAARLLYNTADGHRAAADGPPGAGPNLCTIVGRRS